MGENSKTNKIILIGMAALAVAAALMAVVFFVFREKPVEGRKSITIEVVDEQQKKTVYEVNTDAEYLRQAMEEARGLTFSGTESTYGMVVETVNGDRAVYEQDGAYWSFYVNGEYCNYGIDSQPVEDGDVFTISYTVDTAE